jgi:hypothetical protein
MANPEHLELLQQGVGVWNAWRAKEPSVRPDLSGAALAGAPLESANLSRANLKGTDLSAAHLSDTDLREADFSGARLMGAHLRRSDLRDAFLRRSDLHTADLGGADLRWARLIKADLSEADLSGADLREASLFGANLADAVLTGCHVHGVSAWDVTLNDGTKQQDLIISPYGEPVVTVDNIEVAQFLYLLLRNEKIRDVIDTIGRKGVLLLGRFTEGRIAVLERLREELRRRGYLPIVFNFDKPETKDFTETVRLLAGLSSGT